MASFAIRGVMLDPGRQIERPRVYRDLIPLLARWGYNTLMWHFTDDQGCAMVFPRRPEIATPHALTQAQTRGLVKLAAEHGMDMIPEVECFGHSGAILRLPRYAHLRDMVTGKFFGAMCPFHRDARALLKDLLTDTAETFTSPYIHVGLDEVGFGENPVTRRLLRKHKKWELFADHINWLHEVVTGLGGTMMMWGDHLCKPPQAQNQLDTDAFSENILDRVPKDIVICDWHYSPKPPTEMLDYFLDKGFKVLACPAVSAWGMMVHTRQWNLANCSDFARQAVQREKRGVIGVMNTVWCGWRWLPGATLYGMAAGAQYQKTGGTLPAKFDDRFWRETFGLKATKGVTEANRILHAISPHMPLFARATPTDDKDLSGTTQEHIDLLAGIEPEAAKARKLLMKARPSVRINRGPFDDIVFAADCLARVAGRLARVGWALPTNGRPANPTGDRLAALRAEARDAKSLYREAARHWARSRFTSNDRDNGVAGMWCDDGLTQRLFRSAKYLEKLARQATRATRKARPAIGATS